MGAFYGSITLRGALQSQVAEALRGRRAAVTPTVDGYTVVFDSVCDDQDTDAIQGLSSQLSATLNCLALALIVHDDDVLVYFCQQNGELIDWYNSSPSYFEFDAEERIAPASGNAAALCKLFGTRNDAHVEGILRSRDYVFETDRHRDLVQALGLPGFVVGTALASVDRGDFPESLVADQIVRAADPPPVEDSQTRLDRKWYESLGPEDSVRLCKRSGCKRGSVPMSVLCKPHHFEMVRRRECPFND
jgi:hypothetical protein